MRMPRRSVLVAVAVSLALLPATSAAARPVSTYVVSGEFPEGSVTVEVTDEGIVSAVDFDITDTTSVSCGDRPGWISVNWRPAGTPSGTGVFGHRLDTASVALTVLVVVTTTNTCTGEAQSASTEVSVEIDATAIGRTDRFRDRDAGTRTISRVANVTVAGLSAMKIGIGVIQEVIAR